MLSLSFYLVTGGYIDAQKYPRLTKYLQSKIKTLFYVIWTVILRSGVILIFAPDLNNFVQFILVRMAGGILPGIFKIKNDVSKETPKTKKYIILFTRLLIGAIIAWGLKKLLDTDLKSLIEVLLVFSPSVLPGVLNMADRDNNAGRGLSAQEISDEREKRRSICRAVGEKFAELTPVFMRMFDTESRADELLEKKAAKENELKGIQVRKNVANRMHKDFSQDAMFDMQKDQANRELDQLEIEYADKCRKLTQINKYIGEEIKQAEKSFDERNPRSK